MKKNIIQPLRAAAHVIALVMVVAITVLSLVTQARIGLEAQSYQRQSSVQQDTDHDKIVSNQSEISQLRSVVQRLEDERRHDAEHIREMEISIASAKTTVLTLVSLFGLILTGLGISNYFTMRARPK